MYQNTYNIVHLKKVANLLQFFWILLILNVGHIQLLIDLPGFGIVSESLKWFLNYHKNRKQYVLINYRINNKFCIGCNVPPGNKLGSVFYLLCTITVYVTWKLIALLLHIQTIIFLLFSDNT